MTGRTWEDYEEELVVQNFDEDKLLRLEETLINPARAGWTYKQIAEEIGWKNVKSVQRYKQELERRGFKRKLDMPPVAPQKREADKLVDSVVDTYEHVRLNILRGEKYLDVFERELGFQGEDPCKCCGRYPLDIANPQTFLNLFKGVEVVDKALTTQGKLMGQLNDSPIFLVQQSDQDHLILVEETGKLTAELKALGEEKGAQLFELFARRVWNRVLEESERRRRRLPEFLNAFLGRQHKGDNVVNLGPDEWKQLEEGSD